MLTSADQPHVAILPPARHHLPLGTSNARTSIQESSWYGLHRIHVICSDALLMLQPIWVIRYRIYVSSGL